jgi:hypothetical protein
MDETGATHKNCGMRLPIFSLVNERLRPSGQRSGGCKLPGWAGPAISPPLAAEANFTMTERSGFGARI